MHAFPSGSDRYALRSRIIKSLENSENSDGFISPAEVNALQRFASRSLYVGPARNIEGPYDAPYGITQKRFFDKKVGRYVSLSGGSFAESDSDSDSHSKEKNDIPSGVITSSNRVINRNEIIIDPDGDSSLLCTGCRIPIFSTPSIPFSHGGEQLFLHEHCATMLPKHLIHELHPNHTLDLLDQLHLPTPVTASNCSNCKEVCGTMLYECPFTHCDFRLDLLCVSEIKIVHRSHHHSMMVIRQRDSSFLTCGACDNRHMSEWSLSELLLPSEPATVSYLCKLCSYWIHPDCASLPNAIVHYKDHHHSLFLTYSLPNATDSKCVMCSSVLKTTSGVYICLKCSDYLVHIRCALTRPESFKPVFIRDAEVSDLARLPMANENTSLIPYILTSTTRSGDDCDQETLHQHPLTLHEIDDGAQSISCLCNGCVQFISPPFFSCSQCPDFFLHKCCAHLPSKVDHRVHEHPLNLLLKSPKSDISGGFSCKGCGLRCNGFAYSCKSCEDYNMDVVCALINPATTHDSHEKTHILFMSRNIKFGSDQICSCCSSELSGISYECNMCPNFKLHIRCALLPMTISYESFDEHPLQLISIKPKKKSATAIDDGDGDREICEICEDHIEKFKWYYGCSECDQSFHIDCISSIDRLCRVKLGFTISIDHHGCALALVREGDAICGGHHCGVCGEILKSSDNCLAYECSNCFFGIHYTCAEKCRANAG